MQCVNVRRTGSRRRSPFYHPGALSLVAIASAVCIGCRTNIYSAGQLPPELVASSQVRSQLLDLSRLAVAAPRSDVIQSGDVLEITIATGLEEGDPTTWPLRTTTTGEVNVPNVGPVRVVGLSLTEAEKVIREESIRRRVYRDPSVSVLLAHRKTNKITILGAVNDPGVKELPVAECDLLASIVAAGGLRDDAGIIVEIQPPVTSPSAVQPAVFGGPPAQVPSAEPVRVNLTQLEQQVPGGCYVPDGSVVRVQEQPPQVIHVIGLVNRPDNFEIEPGQEVRLLNALAMAGGRTLQLADKVFVTRNLPGHDQAVTIQASVRRAKRDRAANIRLAAGDVVSVEETAATFIVDTARQFLRFGFSSVIPMF